MSNTPSNAIPYVPQNTLDPAAGLNLSIDVIDALLNTRVISMALTAPPGSPADGDMYVIGAGATGLWAGHDNAFTRYVATGAFWQFYEAGIQAWLLINIDDGNLYKWNNVSTAWEQAAGISEAPIDGSFYGRKNGTWAEMPDVTQMVTGVNGQGPDTDGNVSLGAVDIPFDPDTSSGLSAIDVEAAINELAARASSRAPVVQSVVSSATVTPTFADDIVEITAQAAALALANPIGTSIDALGMVIRIKDNGTARAITYGTQYRAIGVTLPTTTTISKTLYLAMIFNSTDTKWDVVAVGQQA